MQSKKILIVEDEIDLRESLSDLLKLEGHQTFLAKDGLEALDIFHSQSFDLIISDIKMPNLDGIELVKKIKSDTKAAVPMILMSGHEELNDSRARELGITRFLTKPIDYGSFESYLSELFDES